MGCSELGFCPRLVATCGEASAAGGAGKRGCDPKAPIWGCGPWRDRVARAGWSRVSQQSRRHMRRPVEPGRKGGGGGRSRALKVFAGTDSPPHHPTVPMAPAVPLALLALVALLAPGLGVAFPGCDYPVHLWCSSQEIAVACQAESRCANLSRPAAPPVELSLFYESLCPACRGFLVQELFTTWLLLPEEVLSITLVPYGNAEERNVSGKWHFQCQHGPEECLGNMIETCLMHEAKNFSTYFPVIFCLESGSSVTKNLEACLQVYAPQLDGGRIAACVQGDAGAALMHRNAQLTEALDPPHQYVPWIVINGKHTDELQAQAEASLLGLICRLYQVGMGVWGSGGGWGDTSPSPPGLYRPLFGRGRSPKPVGAQGP
uniref:Gamma-interferon-inducible lysosomal thiol reductase n=1 Tax=Accipiter nisus TaxID=211598 RepID=A0A8B9NLA5_9AVES